MANRPRPRICQTESPGHPPIQLEPSTQGLQKQLSGSTSPRFDTRSRNRGSGAVFLSDLERAKQRILFLGEGDVEAEEDNEDEDEDEENGVLLGIVQIKPHVNELSCSADHV